MRGYIEEKIRELQELSDPEFYLKTLAREDAEIRRLWERDMNQNDSCWQAVITNDDVFNLIDRFDGQVCFVEKNVPLGGCDLENCYRMALAEYCAIRGLQKMARFMGAGSFGFAEFTVLSAEEVDKLFGRLSGIVERMENQKSRYSIQD